ncbi:MAG: lytic transglycosylase domain-containing protein [Candidatus Aminicenantes bacterium]|nr:lytic transglycosylase domain-containing protein [Candidatus Aminicenantes bacterium]
MERRRGVWSVRWAAAVCLAAAIPSEGGSLARLRETYDLVVREAAFRHNLDPRLIHAVIQAESAYNRWAVSSAGAQGLMQLMPRTAAHYGVEDPFDARQNIEGGVKYLNDLQILYGNEPDQVARLKKILAAYNAGQEAVKKYRGIPPYAETRTYIDRVLSVYATAGFRRKTVIVDFWTSDGKHIVTNVLSIAAGRTAAPPKAG